IQEHSRRHGEDRAAIAAGGRMADAIRRSPREEHRLVDVRGDAPTAEVLAEGPAAHQDDVVVIGVFLARGAAATGAAAILADPHEGAVVQQPESQGFFRSARHGRRYTGPAAVNQEEPLDEGPGDTRSPPPANPG